METLVQTKSLTQTVPNREVAMHWIRGERLDSTEHRESINPATGEVIGRYVNGVWSRDVDRPLRMARALESATVWINDWASFHDEFEEGGFTQSWRGRLCRQSESVHRRNVNRGEDHS